MNERNIKYWMSYSQAGLEFDVNYVFVDGEWKPYTEITTRSGEKCNWEDAIIVAESETDLPIKYGEYKLMEMQENSYSDIGLFR